MFFPEQISVAREGHAVTGQVCVTSGQGWRKGNGYWGGRRQNTVSIRVSGPKGPPLAVPPEVAEVGESFDWPFSSNLTFGSPGKMKGEKGEI